MDALNTFLKNHYITDNTNRTHTSIKNPKGCFKINDDDLNEFYKLYFKALQNGHELYITERCENNSPIRIDIDFRFENASKIDNPSKLKHFYNKNHYINFIKELWKIINTYLNVLSTDIYITEKKHPTLKSNGDIADGFHIIFPDVNCSSKFQLFLRHKILNDDILQNVFNDIPFYNDLEDVYDAGIIERNWTVYGSYGKLNGAMYNLTTIINTNSFVCNFADKKLCPELINYL
jgi:hypothetical protein